MTTKTLANLRTLVRQESDMENTTFITDAELNSYINQSYFELYDLLIQKYGNDYYAQTADITTDGTSETYTLPNGVLYSAAPKFYKLLGVDLQLSTNEFATIHKFTFADRNRYKRPNYLNFNGTTNLRYRLNNDDIFFTPVPEAGQTIRLWYVPRLTELSDDADTADTISGWDEYIIVDAAIKCKDKEESDVSVLMARKMKLEHRIESAAENRDAGEPAVVADNSRISYYSDNPGWY